MYMEVNMEINSTVPDISLAVRVFANGLGDLGSIPGRVIPKTQKMVLDATLLNTQHYKVRIKGKVGQSREGVAPSPYSVVAIEKGAFGLPSTMVANLDEERKKWFKFDEFIMKMNVERFSFDNHFRTLRSWKMLFKHRWMFVEITFSLSCFFFFHFLRSIYMYKHDLALNNQQYAIKYAIKSNSSWHKSDIVVS